jgi:hypothetical protein
MILSATIALALTLVSVDPIPPETTVGHFGTLTTDSRTYRPLDQVTVRVGGRARGDRRARIRVCDPNQRSYFETEIPLADNRATVSFPAPALLGAHYVYLTWPGEKRYARYVNFQVDAETRIESGDRDFDTLYPFTREAMRLGRRQYQTPRGKFVGYISADTWHFDGIWLRDWIYGLPAYKFWETDMTCGLDRFIEVQSADGMVPDGIERNGHTWRVGLESDVEYILTLAVWQSWQATGDDRWMAGTLPRLEKALAYIQRDPKHWDPTHRLIKRQHSCDTWDFDIDGAADSGAGRHVVATCDQSGYYLAFRAMSQMYAHLGRQAEAQRWRDEAEAYRRRAVALLWDGTKFLHHVHLDPIDHGTFNERDQLAMGNTWAMTRGLADAAQSRRIIDEYRRRQRVTGDAYPWWSLQPGYPDALGYFHRSYCKQGGYANGGLMPWVGGELCRAAFFYGREAYAVELLRQYAEHLRRRGGAQVWYWPNGEPGHRTTNEVPYAGWGMAEWLTALVEGLAGLQDTSSLMNDMRIAPRWAATPVRQVRATVRYAASQGCFAYRMQIDPAAATIALTYTGSGQTGQFAVLLPNGWQPKSLTIDGRELPFSVTQEDASRYVTFQTPLAGVSCVRLQCVPQ